MNRRRGIIEFALALLSPGAALAAEPGAVQTPSILDPAAQTAQSILEYGLLVTGVCAVIFVVVSLAIVIAVVRFRARPGDDAREPAQVYGSTQVELAWTVVPILIVVVLGLVTAREILALQKDVSPEGWLDVTVVGHQWWWEFESPFFKRNALRIK